MSGIYSLKIVIYQTLVLSKTGSTEFLTKKIKSYVFTECFLTDFVYFNQEKLDSFSYPINVLVKFNMKIFVIAVFALFVQNLAVSQAQEFFDYLEENTEAINSDTLHVFYFEEWNDDYTSSKIIAFEGKLINSEWNTLISNYLSVENKAFLIGKMNIDDNYSGFLIRHQSTYSPQKISLLVFDHIEDNFTTKQLIADSGGDGTWRYEVDGWLLDIDEDGKIDLVNWRTERWEDDETEEWHRSDSVYVSFWNGTEFELEKSVQIDTSKFKTYYDKVFN